MYGKEYHDRLNAARIHMLNYLMSEVRQLQMLIDICIDERVDPRTVPLYCELHDRVSVLRVELGL